MSLPCGGTCDDANVCTSDTCDTNTDKCVHISLCDDGDPCTVDSCVSASAGCASVPKVCDDGNSCTNDDCQKGACVFFNDNGNPPSPSGACAPDFCSVGTWQCSEGASVCMWGAPEPSHAGQTCEGGGVCQDGACYLPSDPTASGSISNWLVKSGEIVKVNLVVSDPNSDSAKGINDIQSVTLNIQSSKKGTSVAMQPSGKGVDVHSSLWSAEVDSSAVSTGAYPLHWEVIDKSGRKTRGTLVFYVYTGNIITVGVGKSYGTIQAAINFAQSGDAVLIDPGSYSGVGNVDLHTGSKSIVVVGAGGLHDTILSCGAPSAINQNSSTGSPAFGRMRITGCTESAVVVAKSKGVVTLADLEITGNASTSSSPALSVENVHLYGSHIWGQNASSGYAVQASQFIADGCDFGGDTGGVNGVRVSDGYGSEINRSNFTGFVNETALSAASFTKGFGYFTVSDARFTGNTGGVNVFVETLGAVSLQDSVFAGNSATSVKSDAGGVALLLGDTFSNNSGTALHAKGVTALIAVTGCTFTNNLGTVVDWQNIGDDPTNAWSIEESTFSGNLGGSDPVIRLMGPTILGGSSLTGNSSDGDGGAVWLGNSATVSGCEFVSNSAGGDGGAVSLSGDGASVRDSQFSGNSATRGGAIAAKFTSGVGTIHNCLVNGNQASTSGGGIFADVASGSLTIRFVDVLGNSAKNGGGIGILSGTVGIFASILWDNTGIIGKVLSVPDSVAASVSVENCDVHAVEDVSDPGSGINGSGFSLGKKGNFSGDPLFLGGTSGYRLAQASTGQDVSSPCVNIVSGVTLYEIFLDSMYTTRSDGIGDSGKLDIGFHYKTATPCSTIDDCPGKDTDCTIRTCDGISCGGQQNLPQCSFGGGAFCSPARECVECVANDGCVSNYCKNEVCTAPSCKDGDKNGDESDIDCGGMCPKCATLKSCTQPNDCSGGACSEGVCGVLVIVAPNGTPVFAPKDVVIPAGAFITWYWDGDDHNVISGSPETGVSDNVFCLPYTPWGCAYASLMPKGTMFTTSFPNPGGFSYFSSADLGSGMSGSVTITE